MSQNHKKILLLLLQGKTITVFKDDAEIYDEGIAVRLDGESISACFYDPVTSLQQPYSDFSLVQLLNGDYTSYREGNLLSGHFNFKQIDMHTKNNDKQFVTDIISSECLHYQADGLDYVMGLDNLGVFFSMTLQEWRKVQLDKFAKRSLQPYPDEAFGHYLHSNDLKVLLKGSTIMLKEKDTFIVTAYQLKGDNIEAFFLNKDTLTWHRDSNKGLRDLLNTYYIKTSIIDVIDDYVADDVLVTMRPANVTDRIAIDRYIKTGLLIYRTKDAIEFFTNDSMGPIKTANWLFASPDYDVELVTKTELYLVTRFDYIKFNLIVNDRIDIGHLSEEQLIERLNYFFEYYKDKRLKPIFFSRYELGGCRYKTYQELADELGSSKERIRQILKKGIIHLRSSRNKRLLQNGEKVYDPIPDVQVKHETVSIASGNLDIDVMHYYTGVIAGIL